MNFEEDNTKPGPSLLILAAGLGSRYGGLKQLEPIGPGGESIMEYSLFDAIRAGFKQIVFVIKPEMESTLRENIFKKYENSVEIKTIFQEIDSLPPGFSPHEKRDKPWGTGHAILLAKQIIHGPFGVINADDFYGRTSFKIVAELLKKSNPDSTHFSLLGFVLSNTLSEFGSVSRGLCEIKEGELVALNELTKLQTTNGVVYNFEKDHQYKVDPQAIVSMNFWGFTPRIFDLLEERFKSFLKSKEKDLKAEYYITDALSWMISEKKARVNVLHTDEKWMGITYVNDREAVTKGIELRIKDGEYPRYLF